MKKVTPMNNYFVRYFSARIWKWVTFDVVAKTQEDVVEYVNTLCKPEMRLNPDCFMNGERRDSLKIVCKDKIDGLYIFDTGDNFLLELEHKKLEDESGSVLVVNEQNVNEYKKEEYGVKYKNKKKKSVKK